MSDIGPFPETHPRSAVVHGRAIAALSEAGIPFLVGGAYALAHLTGVARYTRDLDVMVRPTEAVPALAALAAAGFCTELLFPHWLGKAVCGEDYIDVIFSSGNGVATVDDAWFENAEIGEAVGRPALICPAVEMIWSKAWVMERERFDGADVAHLLHAVGDRLDWDRLLARFGPHWRVLLGHLVLFGFIYPDVRTRVPAQVMRTLMARLEAELETEDPGERACQGTLLSREQYLIDVEHWGYRDARLSPPGPMGADDIARWTDAIVPRERIHGEANARRGRG